MGAAGMPKTGGRKKGARNRKTATFIEILDRIKFNIPEQAKELYQYLDPPQRLECLKFLASYAHAKPANGITFPDKDGVPQPVSAAVGQVFILPENGFEAKND